MTFSGAVKTLGLDYSASKSDIREAYRKLVVKNHPDKFQDDVEKQVAERNFKRIQEAYEFLMDLKPAINMEDRMRQSGHNKESEAIKSTLDELLKMRPVSEDGSHWSGVNTIQDQILKFIMLSVPLFVLAMILLFSWNRITRWFSNLF
jgi:hypothetical protein